MRNSETSVQCVVCRRSCCEIIVTNWPSVLVALHVYARDTSQSALTLSRGTWHMLPSHPSLFIFTRDILTAAPWFRPRLMCNNVPAQCRVGKVRSSPGKSFPKSAPSYWAALGPGRQGVQTMVTKMVPDTITNYPSHLDNGVRHDDIRCFETGNNLLFTPKISCI